MHARDLVRFSIKALTDRKLRASLTIIGILIGPATIVALLSATEGFSNSVTQEFAKTGTTTIFVMPQGRGTYLTYQDVPTFQNLPGVAAVVPFWLFSGTVTQGTQTSTVSVFAGDFDELNEVLPGLSLGTGTVPTASDLGGADVGYYIANPGITGAENLTVNQIVTVSFSSFGGLGGSALSGQKSFIIRGIYNPFGQGFLINPDSSIFVPLAEGQLLDMSDHYSGIVVVATSANTVSSVVSEITAAEGTKVRVTAITQILSIVQSITGSLGTILAAVGGISVLVAFIGIMTTMFTTVVERTKEIGVLKALGYSSGNILSIFLVESTITGFIGGALGAGVGTALSFVIIRFLGGAGVPGLGGGGGFGAPSGPARAGASAPGAGLVIAPVISPELILLAVGLATGIGALAGFLPAWRASRLSPVVALRTE